MYATYSQGVNWFGALCIVCVLITVVAIGIMISAIFMPQKMKHTARLAVLGVGGAELSCCVLYECVFWKQQGDGMGLMVLAVIVCPILLLMLVSGLSLIFSRK